MVQEEGTERAEELGWGLGWVRRERSSFLGGGVGDKMGEATYMEFQAKGSGLGF